jgi:serine/threonine-protein kinase
VEAAAWRGRPVSFYIIGPWTLPRRRGSPAAAGQRIYVATQYLVLAAACLLAWLNFRARKTDLRGATKLAGCCWLGLAGANLLRAHHVGSLAEIDTAWKVLTGYAAVNAVPVWIEYLALEPWVRRRWPQTLISWSRFVVKGWRDPLVGRDLLYAAGIGAILALLDLLPLVLPKVSRPPDFPDLSPLMGVASTLGSILFTFSDSLFGMVSAFFTLFLMRVLLRKEWIAAVGLLLIYFAVLVAPYGLRPLGTTIALVTFAILILTMLRYGLIAAIFAYATERILALPHTLDLSAWYADTTFIPLVLIAGLAFYGFRTSLGTRRLIETPE